MSYLTQKTIKKNTEFNGVGLHSGLLVNLVIKPAAPNFGIVFKRIDLKNNNLVYPNFAKVSTISPLFSFVANPTAQTPFLGYSTKTTLFLSLSSLLENVSVI